MDLRAYYAKIRAFEASLESEFVVIASLETTDGGRADVMTEVRKADAARMVVDGKARMATAGETEEFYEQQRRATEQSAEAVEAGRVHFTVLSEADLRTLKHRLTHPEE